MLRILLTLLAANFLVFLWLRGSFDSYLSGGRDPDRVNQQVDAERLRVAPPGRAPNAGASKPTTNLPGVVPGQSGVSAPVADSTAAIPGVGAPGGGISDPSGGRTGSAANPDNPGNLPSRMNTNLLNCSEFAPLDAAKLTQARKFFSEHAAYFVSEIDSVPAPAIFRVYTLPLDGPEAAQKKFNDFRRQGFEGIAVITEGSQRWGMSFGAVATEALAKAMVESLTRRGVRNLRIDSGDPDASKSLVRFRYQGGEQGLPPEVNKDLLALGAELGLKPVDCASKPATRPNTRP